MCIDSATCGSKRRGARHLGGRGGRVHRAIIAAQQALREAALGDRHPAQRDHGQHGERHGEQRERERLRQLVGAARSRRRRRWAATSTTPAGSRRPRSSATSPSAMQPNAKPDDRVHDEPDEVAPRLRVAERRAEQPAQPAARLAVAGAHRPPEKPRRVVAVELGRPAEHERGPDDDRQADDEDRERERQRQAGDPDASRERAREQAEREVAGVTGRLRGDRADGCEMRRRTAWPARSQTRRPASLGRRTVSQGCAPPLWAPGQPP